MENNFSEVFRLNFDSASDYSDAKQAIEASCQQHGLTRLRIRFNNAGHSISVGETHWYRRYLRSAKAANTEHPVFRFHGSNSVLFYQNMQSILENAPYNVVLNAEGFWKEREQAMNFMQFRRVLPPSADIKARKMSDIIAEFGKVGGILPLSEYHKEILSKRFMIEAMPVLRDIGGVIVGEFFTQEEQDLLDDYILDGGAISPDLDTHLHYQDEQFDLQKPYSWRGVVEAARDHRVRIIGTETPFSEHAYYIRLAIKRAAGLPAEIDRRALFDRLLMQNAHAIRMVQDQAEKHPVIVYGGAYHMFDYYNDDTQRVYPGIASSFGKEPIHTSQQMIFPYGRRNACTICVP